MCKCFAKTLLFERVKTQTDNNAKINNINNIEFFAGDVEKILPQIIERDNLIQELTISEDLVNEYFNVEYDSISNTKSYILKDSKKTKVIEIEKENHYIKEYREPQFKKGDKTLSSADLVKEYNKKDSLYNQLLSQYYNECNDKNSIKKRLCIK